MMLGTQNKVDITSFKREKKHRSIKPAHFMKPEMEKLNG